MDLNIGTVTCGTATPGVLDYLGILGLPQHTIEPHLWRVNHPEEKDIAEASDAGSQVLIEDAVRERAHQLFEQRGFEHGHDLDDWLQAEGEIASKKRPDPADKPITKNELVVA